MVIRTPVAASDILHECSRLFPVPETYSGNARDAPEAGYEAEDDQEDDEQYLQYGKPKFDLAWAHSQ